MLKHQRNDRYIDNLQYLVKSYNESPHRSLNGLSRSETNKGNEANVWASLYLKPRKLKKSPITFRSKIGDLVRLSYLRSPFRQTYQQQYTTEVFKIKNRFIRQGIPYYKVVDLNEEPIKGYLSEKEIIRVDKDERSLWYIQKILKKRNVGKKLQYFVQWEGFQNHSIAG